MKEKSSSYSARNHGPPNIITYVRRGKKGKGPKERKEGQRNEIVQGQ